MVCLTPQNEQLPYAAELDALVSMMPLEVRN